jgi:hypothetical protein
VTALIIGGGILAALSCALLLCVCYSMRKMAVFFTWVCGRCPKLYMTGPRFFTSLAAKEAYQLRDQHPEGEQIEMAPHPGAGGQAIISDLKMRSLKVKV